MWCLHWASRTPPPRDPSLAGADGCTVWVRICLTLVFVLLCYRIFFLTGDLRWWGGGVGGRGFLSILWSVLKWNVFSYFGLCKQFNLTWPFNFCDSSSSIFPQFVLELLYVTDHALQSRVLYCMYWSCTLLKIWYDRHVVTQLTEHRFSRLTVSHSVVYWVVQIKQTCS